jgi:hypothetical protein
VPNNSAFFVARAQVGNLTRIRAADDPVLLDARRRMQEAAFVIAIENALDKISGISPEVCEHAIDLLTARGLERQAPLTRAAEDARASDADAQCEQIPYDTFVDVHVAVTDKAENWCENR